MYCQIKIPVTFKGEDVLVVVTELYYSPGTVGSMFQGAVEELVKIENGYVLSSTPFSIDFYDVYSAHPIAIKAACLLWYKADEIHNKEGIIFKEV